MKRTLVYDAVGKTVEQVIEYASDDGLVILFTDNTFLVVESGCYDEEDHYLDITHSTGLAIVEAQAISIEEALGYRLIDEDEAQVVRQKRDSASKAKEAERRRQYEALKREFESGTGS